MRAPSWRSWAAVFAATLASSVLAQSAFAQANTYVSALVPVSSTRVTNYLSDFTYRIKVINQSGGLTNASAFVSSSASATTIIDNEVVLGALAPGATITSHDTFTLRQDRRVAFIPSSLHWTFRGAPSNALPIANAGPDQTIHTGVRVTLNGTGSTDADGNALTYSWTFFSRPAGSAATLSATTAGMPTFTPDRGGTYVLRLIVNDGQDNSAPDEVRISTLNSTPVANAGLDRTVVRGSLVTLDGSTSSDPDFDTLTFHWTIVSHPTGSVATLSDATALQPSITLDRAGSYTFRLTVSDSELTSSADEVTVSTDNSAPVANAGIDQVGQLGVQAQFDGTTSTDADDDGLSFSWTWQSRPNGSAAVLNAPDTPTPIFLPDQAGLYVGQLIVNDGFVDSVPDTAVITIALPMNRPPVAVNDAASTPAGVPVTIAVLANDSDPDANTVLSIASFTQSSDGNVSPVAQGLRFTPNGGFSGVATFSYAVSDGQLSAMGSVTVNVVGASNAAPVANAGADQTAGLLYSTALASVSLAGTVTDDGRPSGQLTQSWAVISGPTTARLVNAAALSTTAYFSDPGTYVLRLTANDGIAQGSDDVQITVLAASNTAPSLVPIADRSIPLGAVLQLHVVAHDSDPYDTLSLSIASGPAGAALTAPSHLVWAPTASQLGTHTFTISVRDAGGLSDTKSFHVTVTAANRPPRFNALNDDTTSTFASYSKTLSATDPDGDALTFELLESPAGMTLTDGTLHWQSDTSGAFTVKVRVRDPAGAFDVGIFKVTVGAAGKPVARDDTYRVKVGESLHVTAPGVLTNDADSNGAALTSMKRSEPALGALTAFNSDGSFTYQAPATNQRPPFAITGRILSTDPLVWNGPLDWPVMGDLNRDGKPDLITTHYIEASILATSGGDGHRLWTAQPACPYLSNGSSVTEVLADIDDDSRLEYVFASYCPEDSSAWTRLQAIADDGQPKWTSAPLTKPFYEYACASPGNCSSTPQRVHFEISRGVSLAITRFTANESPTLMLRQYISAQAAYAYVQLENGQYDYKYYGCRIATGLVSDMGQECMVTMLISPVDGSVQQVLRSTLRSYNGANGNLRPYIRNAPQAVDLDGDGILEIVSGADVWKRVNNVWTLAWQSLVEPQQVAVVDLDGDGKPEIVHQVDHATNGNVPNDPIAGFAGFFIYDRNGVELRRFPVPLFFPGLLTIADVDGDQLPEFVMVQDGFAHAINTDGSFKWTYIVPDHPIWNQPQYARTTTLTNMQVYDLDGDGSKEVIFNSAGWLHILDGRTGAEKSRFNVGRRQNGNYGAAFSFVADWDNDGHADILSLSNGTGLISDPGNFVISAANNDWLPAGKYYGQSDYRPSSIDDSGRVLFDPSVQRSVRNPKQLGTVRDPRTTQGTSFDYVANNASVDSNVAKVFLEIVPPNSPPVFTSRPPTAVHGSGPSPFVYLATAVDPDAGDSVTYSLSGFATNGFQQFITVDAQTGAMSMPVALGFGTFSVRLTITATDSQGAAATQSFVINHVTAAPIAVPGVVGSLLPIATQSLNAAGFYSALLQEQYSGQPAGTVIAQGPVSGSPQPRGTTVLLTVSMGPAPTLTPNVIGRFEVAALNALTGVGFTPTITRQFSNSVEAGVVMAQSIVAGTETPPGAIAVVISAGSGLSLRLSRSVTPVNETIPFALTATDLNGNPGTPNATLTITPIAAASGGLPTVANSAITPAANTRGRYRLTVSDNGRVSIAEFVVVQPNTVAKPTQLALFAQFETTLETMDTLLAEANAARLANDSSLMTAKMTAWVNTWRAVDLNRLSLAVPVVPENGFPPAVADMAGFGVAQTPDDALNKAILADASDDLAEIEEALRDPITPHVRIRDLFRLFNARAERIRAVSPSEYGIVDAKGLYAELLAHRIPRALDALVEDVAHAFGMPARQLPFPALARHGENRSDEVLADRWSPVGSAHSSQRMPFNDGRVGNEVYVLSTLAEQVTTLAVQGVVDAIGGGYTVKKFYQAAFVSAVGGAVILATAHHIKAEANAADLTVTTGASLSINVFEAPYSSIEGIGLNGAHPSLNKVMIVGPELFNAFKDAIEKLKGLGGLASSATDVVKATTLEDLHDGLEEFYEETQKQAGELVDAAQRIRDQLANVYQTPARRAEVSDCLFEPGPLCASVQYGNGFHSVYQSLGLNLPTPILFVVVNQETGAVLVGTPVFVPHP